MEASIADIYQKELAFLNKNFKEGSLIEEKFYGIFYGGQDNLDSVLELLTTNLPVHHWLSTSFLH